MSRRRRRVREAGPVRKSVEVVVSALFGMGVVGVVLLMLQGGASPAATQPRPEPGGAGQGQVAGSTAGLDGGLGIHSAAPGTPSPGTSTVYSAVPAPDPATTAPAQRPSAAQAGGTDQPAGPTATKNQPTSDPGGGSGQTGGATSGSGATPSPSPSSDPGLLGGLVGGLVGGVVGLL